VPENAEIAADTLSRRNQTDYLLHSHVIMPNHVHVLVSPLEGKPLSSAIAGWKRFSATRIHNASGDTGCLWQKDYFDRLIRDWEHFLNVARYIRRNPVKAGLAAGSFLLVEAPWVQRLLS
jgi:REP element-mobilizing transposase RayT